MGRCNLLYQDAQVVGDIQNETAVSAYVDRKDASQDNDFVYTCSRLSSNLSGTLGNPQLADSAANLLHLLQTVKVNDADTVTQNAQFGHAVAEQMHVDDTDNADHIHAAS